MIALLRGRIAALDEDRCIVDVGGVGYEVMCNLRTVAQLHARRVAGEEAVLHVHTAVSEDAIRLFGFVDANELRLFRLLIGVERIGPKAALGILGRAELPVLVRALREGDAKLVATVPGIGPKTAQRVILELRDRVDDLGVPVAGGAPAVAPASRAATAAVDGLRSLGFREAEARDAVGGAVSDLGDDADVNALVAAALRRLDTVPAA